MKLSTDTKAALSGALLVACSPAGGIPEAPLAGPAWVNCYEEVREIVRKTRAGDCKGRPVSDAEARNIAERRRAYIRQAIREPDAIPAGRRLKSVGSGFFVDPAGLLLTNSHIVHDCSALTVSPASGETLTATLGTVDVAEDLALVETGFTPPKIAVFAPPETPLPPRMAVVGYPTRVIPPVRPILAPATPLRTVPSPAAPGMIAVRAVVRPGNSGGALLDPLGRVIGVLFGAVDTPATYHQTGRTVRDIGIALTGRATLAFLERHGLNPRRDIPGSAPADLLEHARGFVARVECWE